MPIDGSGSYTLPPGSYGVGGATISSGPYNAVLDDMAASFNAVPRLDGKLAYTGDIDMGDFTIVDCVTTTSAYVRFSGNDPTPVPTTNGTYNVSSITDHGAGDYTVNFATALGTIAYAVVGMSEVKSGLGTMVSVDNTAQTLATSVRVNVLDSESTLIDSDTVCVAVFSVI